MKFKNYIETESGIKDTSTSPGTAGQLLSSTVAGTSWIDQNTISSRTSEVVDIQVKNISSANGGINLVKGDPVYIYGSVGASARLYVDLADADSTATNNLGDGKMPCVGLLDQDLSPNGEGTATVVGKLRNLITNPIDGDVPNENDTVYVKSGGGLTLTKPTGSTNLIQNVGQVGRVSTSADGNIVVAALLRSNDVPNLPEGRIWIGDGNTIVSDTVYVDEPNNRVGIGTTTPSTDLEVSSTGANGIVISKTSNQAQVSGRLFFTNDTPTEGFALFNSSGTLQINSAAIPNDTSGNNKISIIGSSGNVGIGTTTPTSRLHSVTTQSGPVDYTNRAAILGINNSTDTLYANSVGVAGKVSTSGGFAIYGDASLAGGWAGYFDGKGYFSGNVGIGTGFPTQKLHVNGNARLTGLFYDGTNSGGTAGQILSSDGGQTEWIDGSAIPGVPAGSGTINYLARWTPDANTLGIGVTYDDGTNVGIGTTNPGSKLEVDGEIDASGGDGYRINGKPWAEESTNNLRLGDWDGEGFTTSIFDDNSTEVVRIGNYGTMIKCYALTSTFGANASLAVGTAGATSSGAAVITLSNSDTTGNAGDATGIIQFAMKDDAGSLGYTSASIQGSIFQAPGSGNGGGGVLDFLTAPAISGSSPQTRMRIKDSGNVGIGTTSPSSILHLEASTPILKILSNQYYGNSAINMGNGGSEAGFITCFNNPGISSLELRYDNGAFGDAAIRVGQRNLEFRIDGGTAMYINSSKNVGIGTTGPGEKLTVAGNISITSPNSFLVKNGDSNHGLKYGYNTFASNPTDGPILYGWDAGGLGTKRNSENIALYWNYLGNVGIGTTIPAYPLDVSGEIHSSTYVSATAGLGVDSTTGTLGRGISLYAGPSLYPQYGLLFAQTVDLGTYGGVSGDWATYMTMSGTSTRGWIWKAGTTNSTGGNVASISGVGQLTLASTATATNFILSSDETLKDNIKEVDTKHVDVDWKNFELKSEPGIKRAGVIAQELEIKHPEFVRTADDGLKSVAYIDLLITKIAELEARLEKLEK